MRVVSISTKLGLFTPMQSEDGAIFIVHPAPKRALLATEVVGKNENALLVTGQVT